jgi:6-pyruvoyltetrahydropterin/6-carboxytetrahydropterin synthase
MPSAPYSLTQKFFFDAAHTLRREIEAEGSRRVHGHTYHCEITIEGDVHKNGMVMDLGIVRAAIAQVREQLDHHFLDEIDGLGVPTLENLCRFVHTQIAPRIPTAQFQAKLASVRVWREAMGDSCTFRP